MHPTWLVSFSFSLSTWTSYLSYPISGTFTDFSSWVFCFRFSIFKNRFRCSDVKQTMVQCDIWIESNTLSLSTSVVIPIIMLYLGQASLQITLSVQSWAHGVELILNVWIRSTILWSHCSSKALLVPWSSFWCPRLNSYLSHKLV